MNDRLMVPGQGRSKSARRQAKLDWLPATARGLKNAKLVKNISTFYDKMIIAMNSHLEK